MKAVILAGGLGTRISEVTHLKPKPMVDIGGKPIVDYTIKHYSVHGVQYFIICFRYRGYVINKYFANLVRHMSDATVDLRNNNVKVYDPTNEPWRVPLVDTGDDTMTGGR